MSFFDAVNGREKLDDFVDEIEFVLILVSANGALQYATPSAMTILKIKQHDIHTNFLYFCEKNTYSLAKIIAGTTTQLEEEYNVDGKTQRYLWQATSPTKDNQSLQDKIIVGYNTSREHIVLDSLRRKVYFYEHVLSKLPTNVYWKDRNCVYMGCNDRLARTMALPSRDSIYGMTDFDFDWGEGAAENFIAFDKNVMETGKAQVTEDVFKEADGNIVTVLTNKTPLRDESGETVGILAISVDITDKKKAEHELVKAKEKAEAGSKAKSEFIANMSHDLRTPMTGISGMLDVLSYVADDSDDILKNKSASHTDIRDALEISTEKLRECTNVAKRSTQELLNLFNEILEAVRLESGKVTVSPEPFDLKNIIDKNIHLLRSTADHKKLTLHASVDPNIPNCLIGLRRYLDRSLLNLISNSLKFTDNGGVTLTTKITDEHHSHYKPGDLLVIEIKVIDTGIGIPEEKFDIIFEHFSRLNASYEGQYAGSGLGLFTVKCYIEAMGGSIMLDSSINQGTCFTLTLPFQVGKPEDLPNEENTPLPSLNKTDFPDLKNTHKTTTKQQQTEKVATILLVEDNPAAAMATRLILERLKCDVDIANTGLSAVKNASNRAYDLIVMDIGLPDISGIEATQKIRASSESKNNKTPIVALTGHAGTSNREECINAGMQNVLNKPAEPPMLKTVLKHWVIDAQKKPEETTVAAANPMEASPADLSVIDWEGCLDMCGQDKDTADELLDMLHKDLDRTRKIVEETYKNKDVLALRAELHRCLGGVVYLRLPQLQHAIETFQVAVKAVPQDPAQLSKTYSHLQNSIQLFQEKYLEHFTQKDTK